MVKLGLSYATTQIEGNTNPLHDGDYIVWDNTKELYNPNDEDFDVVSACMFELEKRIWAGIVDSDNTRPPPNIPHLLILGMIKTKLTTIQNNYTQTGP